ncbi:hypothetical protein [Achromobacter phage ehaak_LB5]|nr:hypothetical protein [Achromobacter phage ehaak_LB5]
MPNTKGLLREPLFCEQIVTECEPCNETFGYTYVWLHVRLVTSCSSTHRISL